MAGEKLAIDPNRGADSNKLLVRIMLVLRRARRSGDHYLPVRMLAQLTTRRSRLLNALDGVRAIAS
jgi:hypothetical protein